MYSDSTSHVLEFEPTTEVTIDTAAELLFQFQKIDSQWLYQKQNSIASKIVEHLMMFSENGNDGRVNKEKWQKGNGYPYCSMVIKASCKIAISKLQGRKNQIQLDKDRPYIKRPDVKFVVRKSQFKKEWLKNVPHLLPECVEVIEVLPYLLTCYSINAYRNRVDPFSYVKKGSVTVSDAWTDIFPDRLNGAGREKVKQQKKEGENRKRNRMAAIQSLAKHFVRTPCPQCNAFIYKGGTQLYTGIAQKRVEANMKPIRPDSARKKYIQCWEQYRWFACFCEACKDIEGVNITLSTALFAALWDKTSICYPLCLDKTCIYSFGKVCLRYSGLPWAYLKKFQIDQEMVENEDRTVRAQILDVLAFNRIDSIESHLRQ